MPQRALVISVLCLLVPMALTVSGVSGDEVGDLIWLAALVPAFLLSYYRGWFGATVALALGMVAITVTHGFLLASGSPPLSTQVMLWVTTVLVVVGLGAGTMATMLHNSKDEAERLALADPGTGLPNRRRALIHLEQAFSNTRRGSQLALVLFDLDHFKHVNDRFGHAAGDEVLLDFARILSEKTSERDLSARVGGEEFLTVMDNCGKDGAKLFAEEVRSAFSSVEFSWGKLTASAGIALHEPGMASPDVLMAAADQALYASKQAGRDRVSVAGTGGDAPGIDLFLAGIQASAERGGRGEPLLVVDDDQAARSSIAKALRRFNYGVLEAEGPEQALQIVHGLDEPPAMLITDVIMPSMSGFRLVERLMEGIPDLRVLYLSGYPIAESGWRGAPGQVRAFLKKPVSLEELSAAVRQVLDQPTAVRPDGSVVETLPSPSSGVVAPRPSKADPSVTILATASDYDALAQADIRLRHLGYERVRTHRLGDPPPEIGAASVIVAWVRPPFDDDLEALEALRGVGSQARRCPLLLLAPAFPAALSAHWEKHFPTVFLPSNASLAELGFYVDHLSRVLALREQRDEVRHTMEARVEARTAELESAHRDVLHRLARASEIRDDLTGRHAERVGLLAASLGAELGLGEEDLSIIRLAAPLHDIGKIAIPDAILNKPGDLTATEREVMQRHTVIGARLLSGSRHPLLQEAEQIARSHHERWDGSGYPDGLHHTAIPLSARLVAVADVFDSITHIRPYREASSMERALSIVGEGKGAHFDPNVVDALRAIARRRQLVIDPDEALVAPADASPASPMEIRVLLEESDLV